MTEPLVNNGRRGFLTACAGLATTAFLSSKAIAAPLRSLGSERKLAFYNTHTGESLKTIYWAAGDYVPEGLAEINHVLRDFRTGEVKAIDPELLDQLAVLRGLTDATKATHIISGYRSPKTNAMLRSHSSGVAKKSLHQEGRAIDIRIPGVQLAHLRKAALSMKAGGVGYYPASDFVHIDTGRVRFW